MATHTVAAGAIGSPAFALTADAVSTVTFSEDLQAVEVISDGTAAIWWTTDGSTPDGSTGKDWYIPAAGAIDTRNPNSGAATVVKLLSTGTPTVRVARANPR